jgi:hypothetical protein
MALPCSGTITAAMINTELGLAADAPFDINSTIARTLAGVPSGTISFSDFYCKSSVPPVAADAWITSATYRHNLEAGEYISDGTLVLKADGATANVGNFTTSDYIFSSSGAGNWYTPTTPSVGAGFWARYSNVIFSYNGTDQAVSSGSSFNHIYSHFGSVPFLGLYATLPGAIGAWVPMSSDNYISTGVNNLETDPDWPIANASARLRGTVEISSDSGGAVILASGSFDVRTDVASESAGIGTGSGPAWDYASSITGQTENIELNVALCQMFFGSNGTVTVDGYFPATLKPWYTPTTTGIGNSVYVRLVDVTASCGTGGNLNSVTAATTVYGGAGDATNGAYQKTLGLTAAPGVWHLINAGFVISTYVTVPGQYPSGSWFAEDVISATGTIEFSYDGSTVVYSDTFFVSSGTYGV